MYLEIVKLKQYSLLLFCVLIIFSKHVSDISSQGISLSIQFSRVIEDLEIKAKEEFRLMNLSATKELSKHEVLKVFIVGEHFNREDCTFTLWMPFL